VNDAISSNWTRRNEKETSRFAPHIHITHHQTLPQSRCRQWKCVASRNCFNYCSLSNSLPMSAKVNELGKFHLVMRQLIVIQWRELSREFIKRKLIVQLIAMGDDSRSKAPVSAARERNFLTVGKVSLSPRCHLIYCLPFSKIKALKWLWDVLNL
jgi:hypothetical protein